MPDAVLPPSAPTPPALLDAAGAAALVASYAPVSQTAAAKLMPPILAAANDPVRTNGKRQR